MNDDPAWIAHGRDAVGQEDYLIGNRAGLEALKTTIERALAGGEAEIEETGIDFLGVRVVEIDPREAAHETTLRGALLMMLRALVFGFLLFVLVVGLYTLVRLR